MKVHPGKMFSPGSGQSKGTNITVMIELKTLLVILLLSAVSTKFSIHENNLNKLNSGLEEIFNHLERKVDHHKVKRDSGCPGGEGNYGFNSFNFMTFVLLVYNLVANVNNNLNNNNNNANKNNINAINQDSQTVSSNTNAVNQLMVTVLPIPGKRSIENLIRYFNYL